MSCSPRIGSRFLRLAIVAIALVLGGAGSVLAASAQDATPVAPLPAFDDIPALLETCDSIFGVVIIDQYDQVVFERNADVPFVAASLYKLVLLTETLDRIEAGELDLGQTIPIQADWFADGNGEDSYFSQFAVGFEASIEELLYASGSYSSNVGAQALLTLTTVERLDEFAEQLGLGSTHYWVKADQIADMYQGEDGEATTEDLNRAIAYTQSFAGSEYVNITTPRDMATFFSLLRDDALISPTVSWRMQQILTPRVINDRLPALLPSDVVVIHKTGNLEGVLHDGGIIQYGADSAIVIAMAQAVTDLDQTFAVEQRLGLLGFHLIDPEIGFPNFPATPVAALKQT